MNGIEDEDGFLIEVECVQDELADRELSEVER